MVLDGRRRRPRASTPPRSPPRARAGHVGLKALRGLVADAGGTLEVDSAPGRGTTVRVEVPLSMIRVLVADDHAVVRSGLEQLLSTADDIELVGSAADGERGGRRWPPRERPDVVLMDLSMPVLDGIEATRRIVADDPDVHVVVLTSFSDNRRILDALGAGAIGYLLKHAEPDELLGGDPGRRARRLAAGPEGGPGAARRATAPRRPPGPEPPASARCSQLVARRAAPTSRSPGELGHHRADGEGPPDEHLRPHRRDRPHAGGAVGERHLP